jgi:hypothetical protein
VGTQPFELQTNRETSAEAREYEPALFRVAVAVGVDDDGTSDGSVGKWRFGGRCQILSIDFALLKRALLYTIGGFLGPCPLLSSVYIFRYVYLCC